MNIAQYKTILTNGIVDTGWVSVENTLSLIDEIERLTASLRMVSGRCTPEAQLTVNNALEPYEYSSTSKKD